MYKLQKYGVQRLSDNACIPAASGNTDWQEYQDWIAKGNVPKSLPIADTAEVKEQTELIIREKYRLLMLDVVKPYSEIERETWPKQEAAWRNWKTDGTVASCIRVLAGTEDVKAVLTNIGEKIILYENAIFDLLRRQRVEIDSL